MGFGSLASLVLMAGAAMGQQAAPDSNVIRTSTREVLLELEVRDAHGKLVNKIDPSQIQVFEDGVRQDIRSFRLVAGSEVRAQNQAGTSQTAEPSQPQLVSDTPPPAPPRSQSSLRTVNVVCLILSDLTPATRAFAYESARKFVSKELRPDTFIGVFTLDSSGLKPMFPFTNNRDHLLKAVDLAATQHLAPLHQDTAAVLNGLSLTALGQPTGFGNLANQNSLNGLSFNPSGEPVQAGLSNYGTGDGSSVQDPLGARGDMGIAVQAGLREIDALIRLVRQLSFLPFQKDVVLMSGGITRPPDQLDYWKLLISLANRGGVTFYGLDVFGLGVCQDSTMPSSPNSSNDCGPATTAGSASSALLAKSASLGQTQSTIAANAEQVVPRPGVGVNIVPTGTPQLMESMHQTDYVKFAVSSANTQEALRELAESTGGFLIANTNNSDQLLGRVMEDVDTHFELSYRPASDKDDGRFRKIEVKLATPGLHVQTRSGYFAVPDSQDNPLMPVDFAGLRALNSNPLPHAFDFRSKAFRFRADDGTSRYAIAFEVPIANLTGTPDPITKKQRYHASLLALVKNADGEVVERVSRDVPSDVSDKYIAALRADCMTYERAVTLPPGRYTIETAVVDHEGSRTSTNVLQIDNRNQPGLSLSDLALVHVTENLDKPLDADDPFEVPGRRVSPYVSTDLPAGSAPSIYFVIYPEQNSGSVPSLRAEFSKDGRLLGSQKAALPEPNDSGAIPMSINGVSEPGQYEVKVIVEQGNSSVTRDLKYAIAAK